MARVHLLTGRPLILYYSKWTSSGQTSDKAPIRLDDIHGFMGAVQDLDGRDLDLILHTPGGDPNTVETIVNYLRHKFDGELRAFVPFAAMSAGTMLALACDQICMAAHSRLGPIDPQVLQPLGSQLARAPASAALRQFERAREDIIRNPAAAAAWEPILDKYGTFLLDQSRAAQALSQELVEQWLTTWMLGKRAARSGARSRQRWRDRVLNRHETESARRKASEIAAWFASYDKHHSHGRGISRDLARDQGVVITDLEECQALQDAVLSVHHTLMLTFEVSQVVKVIENHLGDSYFA